MSALADLVMMAWIPVVLGLFTFLPPRRAVITAFVFAWLFLPVGGYSIPGFPDYTKVSATSVGVLLAAAIFDPNRFLLFRPRWFDLPVAVLCFVPMASSLANGLGLYEGASAVAEALFQWGLPYLIGRAYFSDLEGLRELALGIFIGGLIYVPLCLWEIRMSPQLHVNLYGYRTSDFVHHVRYGGFRPTVFMQSGLMVGMWLAMATLIGVWLWATGAVRRLWGVPVVWLLPILLVTTVLSKAVGANILLLAGLGALFAIKWSRTRAVVLALVLSVPGYMMVRATGLWSGEGLVNLVAAVDERRASSLDTRITNENMLTERARERPILGWGRWGRYRVTDDQGRDISITDGLWVITLGQYGVIGLTGLTLMFLLPPALMLRRFRAAQWAAPALAPAVALSMLSALYMIDNLPNAMYNPIFVLTAGGVMAFAGTPLRRRGPVRAPKRARPHPRLRHSPIRPSAGSRRP